MKKNIAISCLLLICTITVSSSSYSAALSDKVNMEYPPDELPSLIISYNLLLKGYGERNDYINNKFQDLKKQLFFLSKLDSDFEKIPDIYNSLIFSNLTFLIQNNIEGYVSGFPAKEYNITAPFKNIMFVTTPIDSINKSILVVLSSVSPEHTTIFKVDQKLNVYLLFDSMKYKLPDGTGICSFVSVRVVRPGIFLFEERKNNPCGYPGGQRNFVVDVTTGSIKVSEELKR